VGPMGAVFYMMTGMHAFHVLTGLIFLLIVWNNGRKNVYTAEKHWGVEAAAVYWHFVDLVWIFFLSGVVSDWKGYRINHTIWVITNNPWRQTEYSGISTTRNYHDRGGQWVAPIFECIARNKSDSNSHCRSD